MHHGHHLAHPVDNYVEPKPAYHEPKPAYHAPKPAYHEPKPAYHEPKPAYHEPKPAYHKPKPVYHEPAPAYHPPEPAYHPPQPAYAAPQPKSLEAIFGLKPNYVTPVPHYDIPTTYKPKMPDYVHQHHTKSHGLPLLHHEPHPHPGDPGYVMHYLPYDNYVPMHHETLEHPPPVAHHPGAAHLLVPGTHVLPAGDFLPLPGPLSSLPPHPGHPEVRSLRGARRKRSPAPQGQSFFSNPIHRRYTNNKNRGNRGS